MIQLNINLLGIDQKEALQRKGVPFDKGWLFAAALIIVSSLVVLLSYSILGNMVASAEEKKAENEEILRDLDRKLAEIKTLEKQRADLQTEEKILRVYKTQNS